MCERCACTLNVRMGVSVSAAGWDDKHSTQPQEKAPLTYTTVGERLMLLGLSSRRVQFVKGVSCVQMHPSRRLTLYRLTQLLLLKPHKQPTPIMPCASLFPHPPPFPPNPPILHLAADPLRPHHQTNTQTKLHTLIHKSCLTRKTHTNIKPLTHPHLNCPLSLSGSLNFQ